MIETGVIHGRFQILHNDHLKYLMAGKQRCRHLVVGITNPDPVLTREDKKDPLRSRPSSNPLTYFERYTMMRRVLEEENLDPSCFSIVPFPINITDLYAHYVPLDAVFFLTIYDAWGEEKYRRFQSMGLKTEILWRKPLHEKGLTSTDIRSRMKKKQRWEHLVPTATARLMNRWHIPDRLRRLDEAGP
jgi:nicotinamide-nucleotide adenylyltransferase